MALLDVYASAIFLEALQKGLKIIDIPLKFDSQDQDNENGEIRIWPSDTSSRSRIQLRSEDSFVVSNVLFQLKLRRNTSQREPTNIVDLGSEPGLDDSDLAGEVVAMPVNGSSKTSDPDAGDAFAHTKPALLSLTIKKEENDCAQEGNIDDATEDLLPDAVASEPTLPGVLNPENHDLKLFVHDSQSSTLGNHHEAVSIFGHIRSDGEHRGSEIDRTTTRMDANDDTHLHDPEQDVSMIQEPTVSYFKNIAQGELEKDTQDSTSIRVDDLLERAGLRLDTDLSSGIGNRNEEAESHVDNEEHTNAEMTEGTTKYTEQSSETSTNNLPPPHPSNQIDNMLTPHRQQNQQSSKSSPGMDLETAILTTDGSKREHVTRDGSQEGSKDTIVVQPQPMNVKSGPNGQTRSKVSSATNTDLPNNSSFSSTTRSSNKSDTVIDGIISSNSVNVLFGSSTNVDTMPSVMKLLKSLGVRKVHTIDDCDYLCIGAGAIKKTVNLVIAVASGKLVISDKWALNSAETKTLLNPYDFIAKDCSLEGKLGVSLSEAIERGRVQHKPLKGYKLFFTPVIKKELGKALGDLKGIAIHGGATIEVRLPGPQEQLLSIVITSADDPQLAELTADGWRCFKKDIITMTVLRSALDIESHEFVIGGENSGVGGQGHGQGPARGRKRKRRTSGIA
ncbi:hypothetical protein MMC11_006159 [Xylographa trunciseda]|nr:hypothetical protein [Xylographa trunciseda]